MYWKGRSGNQVDHPNPQKEPRAVIQKGIKPGPVPVMLAARNFYGATYLFDQISEFTGITKDLQACFPDSYRQVLSIAYYLIIEDRNPLSRFPRWATIHHHSHGEVISSQRSSEFFASITEEARQRFFLLQGKRRIEREYPDYSLEEAILGQSLRPTIQISQQS